MVKYDIIGILKLKDDLTLDFGVYTGDEYIELTEILHRLIGRTASIEIIDIINSKELLNKRDVVYKNSTDKYPNIKFGEVNLDDILFNITNRKIIVRIKSIN